MITDKETKGHFLCRCETGGKPPAPHRLALFAQKPFVAFSLKVTRVRPGAFLPPMGCASANLI